MKSEVAVNAKYFFGLLISVTKSSGVVEDSTAVRTDNDGKRGAV